MVDELDRTLTSNPHDATVPIDPLVGRVLSDRYEIIAGLGGGGMAKVYLAHDRQTGQRVVVKVPRADLAREVGPSLIDRFLREVTAQAELEHVHIVRIRGSGRVDLEGQDLPFVVVDYKGGGHLGERLAEGPQSVDDVLGWLEPIARALDFSHSQEWLHRDVKPDNILFDDQGDVYLSDFGIAKLIKTTVDPEATELAGTELTGRGLIPGAPGYVPPEALEDTPHTPAYDQYSLGVVVARALSGESPKRQLTATATAPMLAKLPRRGARSVRRALSADPKLRFPSCVAFAEALREEAERGPGFQALALVGALSVAAVAAWFLVEPGRDAAPIAPTPAPEPPSPAMTAPAPEPAPGPEPPVPEPAPGPDTTARTVSLGSDAAARAAAMALCERHLGDRCDPAWYADERPREAVLRPYALDPFEVTVAEFRAFSDANPGLATRAESLGRSYATTRLGSLRVEDLSWRTPGWDTREDEPVVHVSRAEAAAYCRWAGRRLPSEDEWEAAARGEAGHTFPWGDDWQAESAHWRASDGVVRPASVGRFEAAPPGLYDLAGNVWEWTSTGPDVEAVLKGGSWAEVNPANLRSAARLTVNALRTSDDIGFRCARDLPAWPDATR